MNASSKSFTWPARMRLFRSMLSRIPPLYFQLALRRHRWPSTGKWLRYSSGWRSWLGSSRWCGRWWRQSYSYFLDASWFGCTQVGIYEADKFIARSCVDYLVYAGQWKTYPWDMLYSSRCSRCIISISRSSFSPGLYWRATLDKVFLGWSQPWGVSLLVECSKTFGIYLPRLLLY